MGAKITSEIYSNNPNDLRELLEVLKVIDFKELDVEEITIRVIDP